MNLIEAIVYVVLFTLGLSATFGGAGDVPGVAEVDDNSLPTCPQLTGHTGGVGIDYTMVKFESRMLYVIMQEPEWNDRAEYEAITTDSMITMVPAIVAQATEHGYNDATIMYPNGNNPAGAVLVFSADTFDGDITSDVEYNADYVLPSL